MASNSCVLQLNNFVDLMKLSLGCHPEEGDFGFHRFDNFDRLLPVLNRWTDERKGQVAYYEADNLNTKSHPGSSSLPSYERENYDFKYCHGNDNMDRVIISYQVTTRVIKKVYITEHGGAVFGRFSPDRTHEISPELIQALQSPYLNRTTFLTQMGYYKDEVMTRVGNTRRINYAQHQHKFNTVQSYNQYSARTQETDNLRFYNSQAAKQQHYSNVNLTNQGSDEEFDWKRCCIKILSLVAIIILFFVAVKSNVGAM